jgi:hypothetical protein
MYTPINVRGTGGSGKSFLMRQFIQEFNATPVRAAARKDDLLNLGDGIEAHRAAFRNSLVYILGNYAGRGYVGGCDKLPSQDHVCDLVRKYQPKGVVLFEGFVVTGIWERYHLLSQEIGGFVWAYMNTPIEVCISRVAERNKGKNFRPDYTIQKHVAMLSTRRKAEAAGELVEEIDWQNPMRSLCQLIKKYTP